MASSPNTVVTRRNQIPSDLKEQQTSKQIASRPAYTEIQLEETYQMKLQDNKEKRNHKKQIIKQRKAGKSKEQRSKSALALGILTKVFPCIKVFANYKPKEYAIYDLLSGISVGLFIIPQAIAFSLLANVKPQFGFYSAFFAMLIYFIFGTSNHLNMSSQGAVSLLVGEAVRAGIDQVYPGGVGLCVPPNVTTTPAPDLNQTTVTEAITSLMTTTSMNGSGELGTTMNPGSCIDRDDANALIALTITMIAGAAQLVMGFLQFGFLTIYLSDPLNSAFTCGAALHILSSQLATMLGTTIPPINGMGKFFLYFVEAFKQLFALNVNPPTILVCAISFLLLLSIKLVNEKCTKYVKIPIPIDIIVLIAGLLLSQFLGWEQNLKISAVGAIESGFRAPRAPIVEHFSTGSGIIVNGFVLGIISYSLSVSLAKTFAVKHGYEVDSNQEMIAYGAVNFGMSWFSTFVSASSIACTSLHESMRGKTLLYSVYAVIITMIGILTFAPQFAPVPKCILSAIILVNLKNMIMQFEVLPRLWRTNRYDFAIWVVTLATILGLDLPIGLLIGVVFSLATVIFRSQAPKAYLLGRVPKTDIYKNTKKNKHAEQIAGLRIFKFDGSLYFASAENFRRRLFRQVAMNPKKILAKAKAHARREGRTDGDIDIVTEVVDKREIKKVLDTVKAEGGHPNELARQQAQFSSTDGLATNDRSSHAAYDPDELDNDDGKEPTVNVFCIILDMSACAFTDAVGIRLLTQIVDDFSKIGVEIYVAACNSLVRSQLRKGNFFAKRSEENGLFVTVHDAVLHALSALYQELVDDEIQNQRESLVPDDRAFGADEMLTVPNHLHHDPHRTSNASHTGDEVARELRRLARRVSRQRNLSHASQNEDQTTTAPRNSDTNRKVSPSAGSSENAANSTAAIQSINAENQEHASLQQSLPVKNRNHPDEVKPVQVFEDEQQHQQPIEDEESRREREDMELNFDEMLKSLPNDSDEESGHYNAGFHDTVL